MYIVDDWKARLLVITKANPRDDGYTDAHAFTLVEDVVIDDLFLLQAPNVLPWIGRREQDSSVTYRVFRSTDECKNAGFDVMEGRPYFFKRWSDYLSAIPG